MYCTNCHREAERGHRCDDESKRNTAGKRAAGKAAWHQSERENDGTAYRGWQQGEAPSGEPTSPWDLLVTRDDDGFRDLVRLRALDEMSRGTLIDAMDHRIIDAATRLEGVNLKAIARELKLTVVTVRKRVRSMRARLRTTLEEDRAMGAPRTPIRDVEQFRALGRFLKAYRFGDDAELLQAHAFYVRSARSAPKWQARDGARCRGCGHFLPRQPGRGRPPRYCNQACRARYRRQQEKQEKEKS